MAGPDRKCSHEGCTSTRRTGGLCNYHAVEKQWGPKWAALCHPNSPAAKKEHRDEART